jgi:hypothetical protein
MCLKKILDSNISQGRNILTGVLYVFYQVLLVNAWKVLQNKEKDHLLINLPHTHVQSYFLLMFDAKKHL